MTPFQRYLWFLLQFARIFGILMRIWAVLIGLFVLADLLRLSRWGYPAWAIVLCAGAFLIGYLASRIARNSLDRLRTTGRR